MATPQDQIPTKLEMDYNLLSPDNSNIQPKIYNSSPEP